MASACYKEGPLFRSLRRHFLVGGLAVADGALGWGQQCRIGLPLSISKRSDGSQHSKLPLHASHVALQT